MTLSEVHNRLPMRLGGFYGCQNQAAGVALVTVGGSTNTENRVVTCALSLVSAIS